jgi:hypothetical protein
VSKPTTKDKVTGTLVRRYDSELVMQLGPLGIYRGSNLIFNDDSDPRVQPYYTVATGKQWLENGAEVELFIDGRIRIAGTDRVLDEEKDMLVQVGGSSVLVMESDRSLSTHLQLESVNAIRQNCCQNALKYAGSSQTD